MPLATSNLSRRSKKEAIQTAISSAIETLMHDYEKTGKIGNVHPRDKAHAEQVAQAIAYSDARRHAGGNKVGK